MPWLLHYKKEVSYKPKELRQIKSLKYHNYKYDTVHQIIHQEILLEHYKDNNITSPAVKDGEFHFNYVISDLFVAFYD